MDILNDYELLTLALERISHDDPYSLIPEIAKDEGVVRITRVSDESRYVVEIGKLNGTPVYDMRGYGILEATDPETENTAD